jgi:hypothetical protein
MKLTTSIQAKHEFIERAESVTFAHVKGELKKKGKMSLRMKQAESTNFMQGEIIDMKDDRRKERQAERKAKRKCYKY